MGILVSPPTEVTNAVKLPAFSDLDIVTAMATNCGKMASQSSLAKKTTSTI